MKLQKIITSFGLCTALLLAACGGDSTHAAGATAGATGGATTAAEATTDVQETATAVATPESLVARSAARWNLIEGADWIQAYDFLVPEAKRLQSLTQYIGGKENFEYRNPSEPKVIGNDELLYYVEVSVLFEPHHPILETVRNRPDDMTEELHIVETWRAIDGEWFWVNNARQGDFLKAHPEIGHK